LVDGIACEEQLDGKGIPEHVGMAALPFVVWEENVRQFEELPI